MKQIKQYFLEGESLTLTEDYRKKEREHKQKYQKKKHSMKPPKKLCFLNLFEPRT